MPAPLFGTEISLYGLARRVATLSFMEPRERLEGEIKIVTVARDLFLKLSRPRPCKCPGLRAGINNSAIINEGESKAGKCLGWVVSYGASGGRAGGG